MAKKSLQPNEKKAIPPLEEWVKIAKPIFYGGKVLPWGVRYFHPDYDAPILPQPTSLGPNIFKIGDCWFRRQGRSLLELGKYPGTEGTEELAGSSEEKQQRESGQT